MPDGGSVVPTSVSPPALNATATPGSNPNKSKAQGSKKYRPKKGSQPTNVQNIVESIEPRKTPIPLIPTTVRDERTPGTDVIGHFRFRHEMVNEFILNTSELLESRFSNLFSRYGLIPGPPGMAQDVICDHLSEFITYYSVATQLYQTLANTEQEGMPYKLKALKYGNIIVPNFIPPLINSLGSYRTPEGVMRVKAIESLTLYYSAKAILAGDQLDLFRPGEVPGNFNQNNLDSAIFESSDNPLDMLTFLLDVSGASDQLHVAGTDYPIDREKITNASVLALVAAGFINIGVDAAVWTEWTDYNESNITFNQLVNNLGLTNGMNIFNDRQQCTLLGSLFTRYNRKYGGWMERGFLSSKFTPSDNGTSAQFLRKPEEDAKVGAIHDYKVSPTESAVGLMLIPSIETDYVPKYVTSIQHSRDDAFYQFASHFMTEKD